MLHGLGVQVPRSGDHAVGAPRIPRTSPISFDQVSSSPYVWPPDALSVRTLIVLPTDRARRASHARSSRPPSDSLSVAVLASPRQVPLLNCVRDRAQKIFTSSIAYAVSAYLNVS